MVASDVKAFGRSDVLVGVDPDRLRGVLLNGLLSNQLVASDETLSLAADAQPQFVSELSRAVARPEKLPTRPIEPAKSFDFDPEFVTAALKLRFDLQTAERFVDAMHGEIASLLGAPVAPISVGGPKYDIFFREYARGAIYISHAGGKWGTPFEVHGAIFAKYKELGGLRSFLGMPTSNEGSTSDATGRRSHFTGGSIYWSSATGAWSMLDPIRRRWVQTGEDHSYLGFPISDSESFSTNGSTGHVSYFQNGTIELGNGAIVANDYPNARIVTSTVEAGHVKCDLTLVFNSAGDWQFTGHFHNAGWLGCTATIVTTPLAHDASHRQPVFSAVRSLGGAMDSESRSDDWDQVGNDPIIRDMWGQLNTASVSSVLTSDTQVGDVLEVLLPVGIAALVIVGLASGKADACGPYVHQERDPITGETRNGVSWSIVPRGQPCPGNPQSVGP